MRYDLGSLSFGKDDAETDLAEGLLRGGFLPTPAYRTARQARKVLVIGRKGTGKSAICQMLAGREPDGRAPVLVTPDRFSAESLRLFEIPGMSPGLAKWMLWRYALTINLARFLVAHAKEAHRKRPKSVVALRRFLADNAEADEHAGSRTWFGRLKGSLKLEAFGVGATLELGDGGSGPSADGGAERRATWQVELLERQVAQAYEDLQCPERHPRPLILVDGIEDVWTNDGEADTLVIGLLRAAKELPVRFRDVSCAVFLRSDIYDLLRFADKDKLHSDEVWLEWTREMLLDLVLTRAKVSLRTELTAQGLWQGVFPGTVGGRPVQDVLVAHTLMRPRDLIQLCNLCRNMALFSDHSSIKESDVTRALERYSIWKLQDLADEYRAGYPFLESLYPVFRDAGYVVTRSSLSHRLTPVLDTLRGAFPQRESVITPTGLLDALYDVGFLGVQRAGLLRYTNGTGERIEPGDDEFHIHPCFRPALRALQPTGVTNAYVAYKGAASTREDLVARVQRGASGDRAPRRDDPERALVEGADRKIREAAEGLAATGLPREIEQQLTVRLLELQGKVHGLRRTTRAEIVPGLADVRRDLADLGDRLAAEGHGEAADLVRTAAHRLNREIWGGVSPHQGLGGAASSDGTGWG
ncbi:P-loop ATPase, Sll1717 family [Actinomadura oligospora]|uniref:P-loop ATPase, Sll1717 family n=1 Tax=Actinomadura oligospora TaxID=111804 RepID=UPI0004B5F204|nr:hypothetical protein [Actinomadura oligospora]